MPSLTQQLNLTGNCTIDTPACLQGPRCYVDASTEPDNTNAGNAPAGLGIFILNLQDMMSQTIHIKARLHSCSSVLMAEAVALALASVVCSSPNLTGVNYFVRL
jgi:hypothetical protein